MNCVEFPNIETIEQAASEWVAKIDRGLAADEEVQLRLWLEKSSMHGELLVKCASMWDLLDVLSPIAKLMPMDALQLLHNKDARNNAGISAQNRHTHSRNWYWSAAALLVMVVGVFGYYESQPSVGQNQIANISVPKAAVATAAQGQLYKTAVGEVSKVKLSDGSELQLNTDSEVMVSFNSSTRVIELLNGEVFFDVAKDESKPFIVNVGSDQVIAVGTAFNIDARPGLDTEVLVAEGKVKVNVNIESQGQDSARLFLTPGQSVTISENQSQVKHEQDTETLLSWREGMLIFQGESLAEAIAEIGRYTSLRFTINDKRIAQIPVGGFFKTGDTEQLLSVLKQNFGVHSTRVGDEVLLHATE